MFPNGTYFEGRFERNKPVGEGIWHFANGNTVNGSFKQSQYDDEEGNTQTKIKWTTQPEAIDASKYIDNN
jgi:radial spoke head protein 1